MKLTITGPEIKAARLRAGLTRKQLGAALLVHPSAICNWENEKSGITKLNHWRLNHVLDLDPNQDKEEQTPPAQEANGAPPPESPGEEAALAIARGHTTITIRLDRRLAAELLRLARIEYRTAEAQVAWIVKQHLDALGGEG